VNVVGLFSGIGGIEYGFHLAGLETTLMCEINDSAQAVLRAHFDAPIVSDVSDIPSLPAGTEVLAGGFPCTDLSQAGRTAGIDGEKSGLVRHMFRLIDTADDALRYVVIENVPNMLKLDGGKAMGFLTRSFEERGYRWAYRTVDTRWWGLPQRRLRVVMVASRTYSPWHVLFDYEEPDAPEAFCREVGTSLYGFYSTEGSSGIGWCQDALPPIKAQPHGPAYWDRRDGTFWLPAIEDCERLQGFDAGWTSAVSQMTRRFRMVGNAVSVPVARWIGIRLWLDRARVGKRPLAPRARIGRAGFPENAYFDGEDRFMMARSMPWSTAPMRRLRSFLKYDPKPLTHRAATGFRKRLRAGTLAPRQDFVDALDAYIERVQL
jgi:DNA (cytosine-5)-methyltransferase 1